VKRAKKRSVPKPRNPVARSPLTAKDGAHGKSRRRQANLELPRLINESDP
jgi:hypothetical protein